MTKATRARYTLDFKEEAVGRVTGGQRIGAVAKTLGLSEPARHNWVKAAGTGGWKGAATPTVSAEHIEISRLKVERRHGMRFETRRRAKDEVIDWLGFYNRQRRPSTLGDMSPMAFEQTWHRQHSVRTA